MQKEPIEKFSDNDFGHDISGTTVGIIGIYVYHKIKFMKTIPIFYCTERDSDNKKLAFPVKNSITLYSSPHVVLLQGFMTLVRFYI